MLILTPAVAKSMARFSFCFIIAKDQERFKDKIKYWKYYFHFNNIAGFKEAAD